MQPPNETAHRHGETHQCSGYGMFMAERCKAVGQCGEISIGDDSRVGEMGKRSGGFGEGEIKVG